MNEELRRSEQNPETLKSLIKEERSLIQKLFRMVQIQMIQFIDHH